LVRKTFPEERKIHAMQIPAVAGLFGTGPIIVRVRSGFIDGARNGSRQRKRSEFYWQIDLQRSDDRR
jgi:hypothetical protein